MNLHPVIGALAIASALGVTGCGGGAALMHPAHTLPTGEVTFGAGASQNFVIGDADKAIDDAIEGASTTAAPIEERHEELVRGGLAYSLMSPGLAPWVGGRVGVGYDIELGLTYTGRSARLDGRYAIEGATTALSFGLGVSNRLLHMDEDSQSSGDVSDFNDGGVTGVGVDVPIILGWRSSANVVQAYGGVRGGYEALFGSALFFDTPERIESDIRAHRWFCGGLLGLIVGVEPVWVGFELNATYQSGSGRTENSTSSPTGSDSIPAPQYNMRSGHLGAFGLTPTAVIIGQFN